MFIDKISIPLPIPCRYFKLVHSLFIGFIWARKHPRLLCWQLTLPKQYGGLAVPDVHKYYQATHLVRLIDWCHHQNTKLWSQLKQAESSVPLPGTPWCYEQLPYEVKSHPLLEPTTRICSNLITRTSLISGLPPIPNIRESVILSGPAWFNLLNFAHFRLLSSLSPSFKTPGCLSLP